MNDKESMLAALAKEPDMVIDRALSLIAVNPNVPLESRAIAVRMLDTLIKKED